MAKLCPFKKKIIVKQWATIAEGITIPSESIEDFDECVKEKCIAWYSKRIVKENLYWETIEFCKLCDNRS